MIYASHITPCPGGHGGKILRGWGSELQIIPLVNSCRLLGIVCKLSLLFVATVYHAI